MLFAISVLCKRSCQNVEKDGTYVTISMDQVLANIVRVEPKQQRSAERVTLLLDTAARLITDHGIGGLTTVNVAEASGSSIGVVYRYFPNIETLLQSLALRNLQRYLKALSEALPDDADQWLDGVDVTIDLYVQMMRSEPGFRAIRFGDVTDGRLLNPDVSKGGMLSQLFAPLVHERYGIPDDEELAFALEVAVETSEALLKRAFQLDPQGDARFIEKAREVVRRELAVLAE